MNLISTLASGKRTSRPMTKAQMDHLLETAVAKALGVPPPARRTN